jgi:3-oxoacyl-[acyl-carrier-protein] synthase-3
LQNNLKIKAPAFDVQAACTGFIYAMSIADNYIKTGTCKNVLIVGAEKYSNLLDWSDRSTCVLFGDGAGAVVLSASSQEGIISSHIHADGQYNDLLDVKNEQIRMKGNEVFKVAVNTLSKLVDETLEKNNMDKSDIDWLVPHQANLRIIKAAAKKLSLPLEQVVVTVDNHANTSAASIPLALNEAVKDGRIKNDQVILLEAFGSGFTWGSVLLRY